MSWEHNVFVCISGDNVIFLSSAVSRTSVVPLSIGYTVTHTDHKPEECTTLWCARSTPVTMKDHQAADVVLVTSHIGSRHLSTTIMGSGFLLTQSPVGQIYSERPRHCCVSGCLTGFSRMKELSFVQMSSLLRWRHQVCLWCQVIQIINPNTNFILIYK